MDEYYNDDLIYENIKNDDIKIINDEINILKEKRKKTDDINVICAYDKNIKKLLKEREKKINSYLK